MPTLSAFSAQRLRLVAPFAAGGATDLVTRLVGDALARRLGADIAIENHPGHGGTRGAALVACAAPDGRTLVMGTVSTHGIGTSVFSDVPYDYVADFAPVALIALAPNVLVVGAHSGIDSVDTLIACARAAPGALKFGSAGYGQTIHVCGELFKCAAHIDVVHAPRPGSAIALEELAAGELALMFDNVLSALPYIRSGKLRALAVTSAERCTQLPDVPSLQQAGIADFDLTVWLGLLAPANTPAATIALLNAEVNAVLSTPGIHAALTRLGAQVSAVTPDEFTQLIAAAARRWGNAALRAGIHI